MGGLTGWRANDVGGLAPYAAGVLGGQRYHTAPEPFGFHALIDGAIRLRSRNRRRLARESVNDRVRVVVTKPTPECGVGLGSEPIQPEGVSEGIDKLTDRSLRADLQRPPVETASAGEKTLQIGVERVRRQVDNGAAPNWIPLWVSRVESPLDAVSFEERKRAVNVKVGVQYLGPPRRDRFRTLGEEHDGADHPLTVGGGPGEPGKGIPERASHASRLAMAPAPSLGRCWRRLESRTDGARVSTVGEWRILACATCVTARRVILSRLEQRSPEDVKGSMTPAGARATVARKCGALTLEASARPRETSGQHR